MFKEFGPIYRIFITMALTMQLTGCYVDVDHHYHPWWHHHDDVVVVHDR